MQIILIRKNAFVKREMGNVFETKADYGKRARSEKFFNTLSLFESGTCTTTSYLSRPSLTRARGEQVQLEGIHDLLALLRTTHMQVRDKVVDTEYWNAQECNLHRIE